MRPSWQEQLGADWIRNQAWKAGHVRGLADGALPFGKRLIIGRDARGLKRRQTLLVWVD